MAFGNYSFTNVNVIFGILEISGFAEGDDVVNISFETEQFKDVAGAKGDVARVQTNDNRATIKVKLLQTSSSYKILMDLFNLDRETGETFVGNNTWINKAPDIIRGQNANAVEFTFRTDFGTMVIV